MSADHEKPLPPATGRVVTADTLTVASAVLGRLLAEPWRRLAAMGVDLAAVGVLSLLSKPCLGIATGTMFIVLFGNAASAPLALKVVRGVCRALGSLVILLSVLALGHTSLFNDRGLRLDIFTGAAESAAMKDTVFVRPDASAAELHDAATKWARQVDELKAENRELQRSGRSWLHQARTFAHALGITFGWSGVYFTLLTGLWNGRTLGKFLLRSRVAKINGAPLTFFDAFVRHGGYVAGVAMGLTGFLKLLWEPNRQAVEDRIASTVVVRET